MEMRLRTIVYSSKVEIEHVPVFFCSTCQASELHPIIKKEITTLIRQLGNEPAEQRFGFDEVNEFAYLLASVMDTSTSNIPIEELIDGRINELLDLLLLARSLHDETWMNEIRRKLLQITNFAMNTA